MNCDYVDVLFGDMRFHGDLLLVIRLWRRSELGTSRFVVRPRSLIFGWRIALLFLTYASEWESGAPAHKEKCGNMAPRRAKDGESGADFSRAQGKGFLTPAAPRNDQRIPCRSSLPEFLNN